ncbi:hypothetical protein AB0M29_44715 [Streptomyces sp. NPDC051976]|uniref:hypothetical protein n=1 Tax=Streptomyces sp. NPDC051976 TaxID=3154947 RepID=UPI003439D132
MADIDFPYSLVELQKRSHQAWADVERHRKEVDARRVADADERDAQARAVGERVEALATWQRRQLPPGTPAEDERHGELMAAVTAAAEALRAALVEAGLGNGYDVVQELHRRHARNNPPLPGWDASGVPGPRVLALVE